VEYIIAAIIIALFLPWTCLVGAGVGFLAGGALGALLGIIVGLAMAL
jgi:hypothetical protein